MTSGSHSAMASSRCWFQNVPVVSGDPLGVVFDEDAGDPGLPRPVQRGTGAVGDDGDDVHTVPEVVDHRLQQRSRAGREDDDT